MYKSVNLRVKKDSLDNVLDTMQLPCLVRSSDLNAEKDFLTDSSQYKSVSRVDVPVKLNGILHKDSICTKASNPLLIPTKESHTG